LLSLYFERRGGFIGCFVVDPSELLQERAGLALRWVRVDAVGPRALVGHVAGHLPHAAVALEPRPERHHQHLVASPQPPLRLHVRQHVPHAARRRVPPPVQRHPQRLDVSLLQPETLLHRVDHRHPAGVEADVVHPCLEVDLQLGLPSVAAALQQILPCQVGGEPGDFHGREDARQEALQVGGERAERGLGEGLADADPAEAIVVLALHDAGVGVVAGRGGGAHKAAELHLGAAAVGRVVAEQHGCPAAPEQALCQHHGPLLPGVPVRRQRLRRYHQRHHGPRRPSAHGVPADVHRDQRGAAPHPGEVVRRDVLAHAVPAHHPGREAGLREEAIDVDDEHVDVAGPEPRPGEELRDGAVEAGVHLVDRIPLGGELLAAVEEVPRRVGPVAESRAGDEADEEAKLRYPKPLVALDNRACQLRRQREVIRRLVADVVQEVAPHAAAAGGGRPCHVRHREWRREEEHDGEQRRELHSVRMHA
ncbi:Os03g0383100, partial [Oryza sativa Japonica Group]